MKIARRFNAGFWQMKNDSRRTAEVIARARPSFSRPLRDSKSIGVAFPALKRRAIFIMSLRDKTHVR